MFFEVPHCIMFVRFCVFMLL